MFCENCRYEYRDGITVCPDCGAELVPEPPPSPEPEFDPNERGGIVCTAADEFEAEVMIAKLRAEGIYAYKQYIGTDDYNRIVLGRTILGVRIIVGEKNLSEARQILFG